MTFNEWNSVFNWFVAFVQKKLLYSMPSRRASSLVGPKMVSKCRALFCFYCTRVSWKVNSYPDQYITGRGLILTHQVEINHDIYVIIEPHLTRCLIKSCDIRPGILFKLHHMKITSISYKFFLQTFEKCTNS